MGTRNSRYALSMMHHSEVGAFQRMTTNNECNMAVLVLDEMWKEPLEEERHCS